MEIINSNSVMARALATYHNPWLKRRLSDYRDRLQEADCEVGELGPIVVVEPGDTLEAIETATGVADLDSREYCEGDHGWYELAFVTGQDGGGAVLLVPDRDGIDPALLAIVRSQPRAKHEQRP